MNINWHKMKNVQNIHRLFYRFGLGSIIGIIILLLTTTGRKSGLARTTPLQYELIDGRYYLGAARGRSADWVRNIEVNPRVQVRVKRLNFQGTARVISDPKEIADFIEVRLQRHPFMIGMIMEKAHKLPRRPSRQQLEALAITEVVVVITPDKE